MLDINAETAQAVAAETGGLALACDVTDGAQVADAVAQTRQAFGGLDIVVNNAGWTVPNGPLLATDEAAFRRIYDVNVLSIFHMCHAVVPLWRDQGGA